MSRTRTSRSDSSRATAARSSCPLLVGLTRAKELLFLGDRVSAEEAVRLGIANRAVPRDKLMDEAMDLAGRLAALPAQALRETKRAVNLHLEQALATVLEPALLAERDTMHSPDHIASSRRSSRPAAAAGPPGRAEAWTSRSATSRRNCGAPYGRS